MISRAIYRATDDTVTAYTSVLPSTGSTLTLRLPGAPFAGGSGGGGGSSATIEYVSGTAETSGPGNRNVSFEITNSGTASVEISSLMAEYSTTAYFREIVWDGSTVFSESNPAAGDGDTCNFTSTQTLAAGATITIELDTFKQNPTGGSNVDMSNTDFTITFSDGSVITFNSGT